MATMTKKTTKTAKKLKTYVALVLDRSGSMYSRSTGALQCYNGIIDSLRKQGQDVEVAVIGVGDKATLEKDATPVADIPTYTHYKTLPQETALLDGIGLAIDTIKNRDKGASYLVLGVTDGLENHSRVYDAPSISKLIKETQDTDKWTFAFNVPPGHKDSFARKFGIPVDNIREWELTNAGMVETQKVTNTSLDTYFAHRGAGGQSVRNFYTPVETDLSKLSARAVKQNLDNISDNFAQLPVPKEMDIRTRVEKFTGKTYVIGAAYYELTKPEKVQGSKQLLIMDRKTGTIYGGNEVRELLGLPTDGTHAKVTPGNHANYRIFCNSRSVNRKLVRGTTLLVDKTVVNSVAPVWQPKPKTA